MATLSIGADLWSSTVLHGTGLNRGQILYTEQIMERQVLTFVQCRAVPGPLPTLSSPTLSSQVNLFENSLWLYIVPLPNNQFMYTNIVILLPILYQSFIAALYYCKTVRNKYLCLMSYVLPILHKCLVLASRTEHAGLPKRYSKISRSVQKNKKVQIKLFILATLGPILHSNIEK
jgi:hypothetical protein